METSVSHPQMEVLFHRYVISTTIVDITIITKSAIITTIIHYYNKKENCLTLVA